MKGLSLLLLVIVIIEFNLQWTGTEHQPNWIKAWNRYGNEVPSESKWEKVDGVYYWNIYDLQGNLITFLNFWTY